MQPFLFIILFIAAFLERTVFDLGPNIELVTATALLASVYLGGKWSIPLLLLVLILSDIIIGNSNIFLFTWSGLLIPIFLAGYIFKRNNTNKVALGTGLGILTTLFFFVWTNFGVWALDSWGMYSNDLSGLTQSYINALPFLRLHMASTLMFVPVGFILIETLIAISKSHLLLPLRNLRILRT